MSIVGFLLLSFLSFLSNHFKSQFGISDFDTSDLQNALEGCSGLYNIFAWVNEFVPVSFLLLLAGLTTVFYGYKLIISLVRFIFSIFKR